MTEGGRALVRISAAMATRRKDALHDAFDRARGVAPDEAIEEVVLQGYLFLGFPIALNAMSMWRRISGRAVPGPSEQDCAGWKVRGQAVCAEVYTHQVEQALEVARPYMDEASSGVARKTWERVLRSRTPDPEA